MAKASYVPHAVFVEYVQQYIDLPKGHISSKTRSIRRALWFADDAGKIDQIETRLIDGEPCIKTTKKNISAFVEIYKEWQGRRKERKETPPVECVILDDPIRDRDITDRRFSRYAGRRKR